MGANWVAIVSILATGVLLVVLFAVYRGCGVKIDASLRRLIIDVKPPQDIQVKKRTGSNKNVDELSGEN